MKQGPKPLKWHARRQISFQRAEIKIIGQRRPHRAPQTDIDARKRRERNFELRNPRPLSHFDKRVNQEFFTQNSRPSSAPARIGTPRKNQSAPEDFPSEFSTTRQGHRPLKEHANENTPFQLAKIEIISRRRPYREPNTPRFDHDRRPGKN